MDNAAGEPDYEAAIAYALHLLHTRLPEKFTYHCAAHTEFDVIPAVLRLAQRAGVSARNCRQLQVAAAYHDLGYIHSPVDHEATGIAILREKLPQLGFRADEIARIETLIMATRMPQSPDDGIAALLSDADLDSLGRDDFMETSTALWQEMAALGRVLDWADWLQHQLRFLEAHRYHTPVAQALRGAGKQRNIALLKQLLGEQAVV